MILSCLQLSVGLLLWAFQCVAMSVSMSCYEWYGLALLLTLQRYYIWEGRCPTLSDRREIFLKFCSSSHDLRIISRMGEELRACWSCSSGSCLRALNVCDNNSSILLLTSSILHLPSYIFHLTSSILLLTSSIIHLHFEKLPWGNPPSILEFPLKGNGNIRGEWGFRRAPVYRWRK